MKNKLKGGIESIIAVIILSGLVIALIIAVILPSVKETSAMGDDATSRITNLRSTISRGW